MTKPGEERAGLVPAHAHRWRIEPQGMATSAGNCACGATKDFANGWTEETRLWTRPTPRPPRARR